MPFLDNFLLDIATKIILTALRFGHRRNQIFFFPSRNRIKHLFLGCWLREVEQLVILGHFSLTLGDYRSLNVAAELILEEKLREVSELVHIFQTKFAIVSIG